MSLQRSLCLFGLVLAGGCSSVAGPPAEVASVGAGASTAPPEWIEVPLGASTWWEQGSGYQSGVYEIPVAAGTSLEHMIGMNAGALVVYQWTVEMDDPALLTAEFHGHTERSGPEPGTVMFYKRHKDGAESGSLRAPFTGVHGWYLDNTSTQDLIVRLQLSGFFTDQ